MPNWFTNIFKDPPWYELLDLNETTYLKAIKAAARVNKFQSDVEALPEDSKRRVRLEKRVEKYLATATQLAKNAVHSMEFQQALAAAFRHDSRSTDKEKLKETKKFGKPTVQATPPPQRPFSWGMGPRWEDRPAQVNIDDTWRSLSAGQFINDVPINTLMSRLNAVTFAPKTAEHQILQALCSIDETKAANPFHVFADPSGEYHVVQCEKEDLLQLSKKDLSLDITIQANTDNWNTVDTIVKNERQKGSDIYFAPATTTDYIDTNVPSGAKAVVYPLNLGNNLHWGLLVDHKDGNFSFFDSLAGPFGRTYQEEAKNFSQNIHQGSERESSFSFSPKKCPSQQDSDCAINVMAMCALFKKNEQEAPWKNDITPQSLQSYLQQMSRGNLQKFFADEPMLRRLTPPMLEIPQNLLTDTSVSDGFSSPGVVNQRSIKDFLADDIYEAKEDKKTSRVLTPVMK